MIGVPKKPAPSGHTRTSSSVWPEWSESDEKQMRSLEEHFAAVQQKHHPGSRDVLADPSFIEGFDDEGFDEP